MKIKVLLTIGVFALLFFSCEKDEDSTSESDNKMPVLTSISNKIVTAGETENIEISATDMDGDSLTFSIPTNPGFLSITGFSQTGNTATATLVIEPGENIKGGYNATIQVSDGEGGTDSESFTIEVNEPSLNDYFPIETGAKWNYRVDFPQNCYIKYSPWFEYPEGLLSTTLTHGNGSWDEGQINFEILVNSVYETTSNSTIWDISLNESGLKFYFYQTNAAETECRLRLTVEDENADLDLIAVLPVGDPNWIIARSLTQLSSDDLSQKYTISVPAGEFKNCVKSIVSFGNYPIETYLAPNIGIVKAIGKDNDETILYTLELSGSQINDDNSDNNNDDNAICESFDNECGSGTYSICCTDSSCYYLYNGKKYYCNDDDCTEAAEELVNDMCDF